MKKHKKELIDFGKRIKAFRTAKKLTQADLAGLMDCDVRMIKYLESQEYNPTLNTIIGLSKALDIPIKDLF